MKNSSELLKIAKELIILSKRVESLTNKTEEKTTKEVKENASISLEQVREVLAGKAEGGNRQKVKNILIELGANKLTEVEPADYQKLLKRVETI